MMRVDIQQLDNLNHLFLQVMSEIFLRPGPEGDTFCQTTGLQKRVLLLIGLKGPQKMSGLARGVSVSLPSATATIDKMVQADLVRRKEDPDDRRVTMIEFTPNGKKYWLELNRIHEQRLGEVLGCLTPDKQGELIGAFEKIYQLLKEIRSANDDNHTKK